MTGIRTLVLGQADITQTMQLSDYIEAVEGAFRSLGEGLMTVPNVVHIPALDGAFHVKSAAYNDGPCYVAVKVNGNFPDNQNRRGLPTIQGAIVLCDGRNGALLAVIDSIEVTAMRTAAASAVAAKHLAHDDSTVATVVGCGIQGAVQLRALIEVLPLKTVFAFDIDTNRRDDFVRVIGSDLGLDVHPTDTLGDATRSSQIIVTCTPSRSAYLGMEHVSAGTFIAAVGADNDDKQELYPELLANAKVVVDLIDQCAEIGDLHHALDAGAMERCDVVAELGAIVSGTATPNFHTDDIIIFDSTGSAIQDVAAAGIIYERAMEKGIGLSMKFSQ